MEWIVIGTKHGAVVLSSRGNEQGVLPKGSYLTIDSQENASGLVLNKTKFILRVEDSAQSEMFAPSPLIIDMNLDSLMEDGQCKNIISAVRVMDDSTRTDGLVDTIRPGLIARRSNQSEINQALGLENGPKIFPATIFESVNSKLIDSDGNQMYVHLPEEVYWHQIQITGKTGSGKTVASKYLAQYFVENKINISQNEAIEGAVLAINVKDIDFLTMDKKSESNQQISDEWEDLDLEPRGLNKYEIYFNASDKPEILFEQGVNRDYCTNITLDVKTIDPSSLLAIVQSLTEIQQQHLPDIFRRWQRDYCRESSTYTDFLDWFNDRMENDYTFYTLDISGRESERRIHASTAMNIATKLQGATAYFNQTDANGQEFKVLEAEDILQKGKLSVINVSSDPQFGSIVLRHILNQILAKKQNLESNVPVLIIIDEVHQFYKTSSSKEALGVLDTICRVGRSSKIGVIFSTQNEDDLPGGVSSVVNTKLYFKTDGIKKNNFGVSQREVQGLRAGYGVGMIHGMPNLNAFKFPLSLSGVKL